MSEVTGQTVTDDSCEWKHTQIVSMNMDDADSGGFIYWFELYRVRSDVCKNNKRSVDWINWLNRRHRNEEIKKWSMRADKKNQMKNTKCKMTHRNGGGGYIMKRI